VLERNFDATDDVSGAWPGEHLISPIVAAANSGDYLTKETLLKAVEHMKAVSEAPTTYEFIEL